MSIKNSNQIWCLPKK